MKKIIIFFIMLTNILITSSIIKGVKASNNDVTKPLVLLVGGNYTDYFNYEGYEIINNNVNTNKCGNYNITYKNTITEETLEKKVYVKDEKELLSDKCYAEKYHTIYNSSNRLFVTKVLQAGDFTYISLSEEIDEDIYNLRFVKLKNDNIVFDKIIMEKVNGNIADFILGEEEIVLLINKSNDNNQDVYIKTLSYDGKILYEKHIEGNNYDRGCKVQEERDLYFFIIETLSNSGSIYNSSKTKSYITVYTINKIDKNDTSMQYITNDFDIKYVDAYASRFGFLVLFKYFDTNIRLTYHELARFDSSDGTFWDTRTLSANIGEEYSKIKEADNGELYYIVTKYSNTLGTNEYSLYSLNSKLMKSIINTYHYEKSPNLILSDFLVYDKNSFTMLYSLVDLTKNDPYGYLYQIYDQGKITLEIENYSSKMLCSGFFDKDTLLFKDDNKVIINDIEYLIFTMLNNDITVSNSNLSIYPMLYISGEKINLDLNKSKLNFDINTHGLYDVTFYFSHYKMDVALYGFITVDPYININNGETYDKNLRLTFTGQGMLNDLKIESGYVVSTPGSYMIQIIGVNDSIYEFEFNVEEITKNEEIFIEDKLKLNTTTNELLSSSNININNNIKESDVINKKNYNWMLLIPFSTSIILVSSLFKKRG